MYRTVPLGKTVFKIVTGSSVETQVSTEAGGTADTGAMKI